MKALDVLDAELFSDETDIEEAPKFEIVACNQGQDAIDKALEALHLLLGEMLDNSEEGEAGSVLEFKSVK